MYVRVTIATNVTGGSLVNEWGQLDLTLAREEDSMFYECTGVLVDVAGANASQLFRVEITMEGGLILANSLLWKPQHSSSLPTSQISFRPNS